MLDSQVDEVLGNPDSLQSLSHPIIYHHLLKPQKEYNVPSALSLKDEALLLVNAGVDTVSNALIVGVVKVLENREMYERLQEELRGAWPRLEERPKYEELESLPYLVRDSRCRHLIKELNVFAASCYQRVIAPESWNYHSNDSSRPLGRGACSRPLHSSRRRFNIIILNGSAHN